MIFSTCVVLPLLDNKVFRLLELEVLLLALEFFLTLGRRFVSFSSGTGVATSFAFFDAGLVPRFAGSLFLIDSILSVFFPLGDLFDGKPTGSGRFVDLFAF